MQRDERKRPPFRVFFNRYRLRAGCETLGQFGDMLADEGFIYDDSMFSHWKTGRRIPRKRKVVLAILIVFIRYNALTTVEESNALLASLGLCGLNAQERHRLFGGRHANKAK